MAVVKDKKDVSVLIETHLPEFVTERHPKFKKFIEKYYEFMESHQLYFGTTFTFNEDKLVDESDGTSYFLYEDGINSIQLESERDTENDANIQFTIGETLTGNTSQATAVVTGTKGNTVAFIKPSNDASFKYGEKVTGSATRAYATLANGVVDGTFPDGSIESFRSRGASAAVRDLKPSQDIDLASEGLIDVAWKKEFYVNVPKTATTDRRQLLKQMKEVYRAKGNESSFHWLFRTLYAKTVGHIPGVLQEIEFYYPGTDLLKVSDGKWVLDKTIKFITDSGTNIGLFTGKKITGGTSGCTALVEKQLTYAAGPLEITELTLSNILQGVVNGVLTDFTENEIITSDTDSAGLYATATTTGIVQTIAVVVGGTNYVLGNEIHITKGGGHGARASVTAIKDGVVDGITIIDSGDGYSVGDTLNFINEDTGGAGAAGTVKTIINTTEVLKNTDFIQTDQVTTYRLTKLNAADYGSTFVNHNANTHLYGNSSLIFSASIKLNSAKLYNVQNDYSAASHILAGDRIAKQASINTSDKTITQSVRTVTLSSGLSETEKLDVIGGKLVYANGKINIITGFSSNTVLLVKDDFSFGVGENFNINYASNTYWGTIISASNTEILYSVGSHYRGSDLGTLTVQNFVNDDTIIIYDSKFTKLGAAAAVSGVDAHNMHNGVTFQVGNTPISNTTSSLHNGAFNMTTVTVGAIDTFTLSSGGAGYTSSPPVSVANSYIPTLGNALDVLGAPNALLNLNLHSYDSGTISQDGAIVTLDTDGSFPDANSGVLTLTYANGTTAQITSVTNSSTLSVSTEKIFGSGAGPSPDRESYSLSYMAHANNITRNTLLYNDDYSARGRVLDFIDKSTDYLKLSRIGNPVIANGNTTLRVDMTTAQDFGGVVEHILLQSKTTSYEHEKLLIEGVDSTDHVLIETSVEFLSQENGSPNQPLLLGDVILQEDGTTNTPNSSTEGRIYTEDTSGERVTAHSNSVSTYTTNTITQSGTTVTGIGTVFPNDFVRGTITYADDATSTITGYTNATSFTVEDSKTIGSAQAYSISYNPVLTWGTSRNITVSAGNLPDETGNRTVTVTETGHYLRTGDKVKISGSETLIFNGVFPITVSDDFDNNTYTYTLPEDNAVTSPVGAHKATPVASAWPATSNAVIMDTSVKGKNAVIEVSTVAIGSIEEVSIYNFGAGYVSTPTLSTTAGDKNAEFTVGLGALTTYGGYNLGTTGTLSGVPKVQDNRYYQAFSYVLKSDFDVNQYRDAVKRFTHPSGMIMFGEVAIRSNLSARLFNTAVNTVDDIGTIEKVGPNNSGRKYHNITLYSNAVTTDVQFQSFGGHNEIEIYTADHPWQAMNARLETDDSVNLMLELYEEIGSIARTNSTMHTVTQTLHGLETGDVIEFSGAYPGYSSSLLGDQFTGQEWQGEHVITTTPTTNTYTITPPKDDGAGQMYDGYLYIQLEDQATGNNIITEDYSYTTYMVWDNTGNNDSDLGPIETDIDVGDNILQEDGLLFTPSESTEGVLLFDSVEAPVSTTIQLEGQTISNENLRLEDDSGTILLEGVPDNPGNIITEKIVAYEIFILEEGTTADLGMTGSGYIELQDLSSSSSSDEVRDSRYGVTKYLLTEESYTGFQVRVPGDYLLIEGHGDPEFIIMEPLASVEERVPSVIVLSDNLLMQPTNYLRARTASYANTFRASATNWDDPFSGAIIGQDTQQVTLTCTTTLGNTTITTSDTSPIVVGMAVRGTGIPTIPVANVASITNSTTFQLSEKATLTGSNSLTFDLEFEILLERGGTFLYPKLQFPEAETGTVSIDMSFNSDLLLEDDNGAYGWGYILDEESGSMGNGPQRYISLEEDTEGIKEGHITQSIPYMETKPTIDLIDSMGFHLITEDYDHFIEEGDDRNRLSRFVTGERYIKSAPIYQFIDYLNTVGRLLTENDELLIQENESYTPGELHYDVQQGYLSLESLTSFTDENNETHVEFHLADSMGSHIITEDYDHFIVEEDNANFNPIRDRFVTEEPHFKTPQHEIIYNYPNGNPGLERLKLQALDKFFPSSEVFNDWKDTNIATVPYGMQACRPHYYSQWASIDLGFVDGKFEMEDNTGIILLEHPVTNQDKLIQEDFPGVQEDIFATDKARFDFILLEGTDHVDFDRLQCESLSGAGLVTLEWSHPGPESVVDLVQEIALEDDSGYIQLEQGAPDSADFYDFGYLISEEVPPAYGTRTGHQSWTVLPAYQYTRIPTRLNGLIDIADGGTTVTGSVYCSFTAQLKVGEEFQTEDVTIIAEESGGDVVLETDERLEHEDITLGDADAFVLDTVESVRLQDWRWLISQENLVIAAHSSHANVQGVYLERTMSLDAQDDSYLSVGESSYGTNISSGGNEATAWDTNDESFWIPTHESSDGVGITRVVSGSNDGTVRVEDLEWENVNMIWEDFSKQLIIEPQAFIVGSITNDTSMTVTRKHLGGVTEAEYRL